MKAKQRVPALRGGQPDDLASKQGHLRSNFLAGRVDETENHAQQPGNLGNVGWSGCVNLPWPGRSATLDRIMQSSSSILAAACRRLVRRSYHIPFLMYGMLSVCLGLAMYLFGVLLVVPRYLMGLNSMLLPFNEWIVWYSGVPIMVGFGLALGDLTFLVGIKRRHDSVRVDEIGNQALTVALTA
jgi:hypothetical protein